MLMHVTSPLAPISCMSMLHNGKKRSQVLFSLLDDAVLDAI